MRNEVCILAAKHWKCVTIATFAEWFAKVRYPNLMCKLSPINKYRMSHLEALEIFSS